MEETIAEIKQLHEQGINGRKIRYVLKKDGKEKEGRKKEMKKCR